MVFFAGALLGIDSMYSAALVVLGVNGAIFGYVISVIMDDRREKRKTE